jgi:hypothetical protein
MYCTYYTKPSNEQNLKAQTLKVLALSGRSGPNYRATQNTTQARKERSMSSGQRSSRSRAPWVTRWCAAELGSKIGRVSIALAELGLFREIAFYKGLLILRARGFAQREAQDVSHAKTLKVVE